VICWQCEKKAAPGLFCAGCGAILPASEEVSFFEVLGEEARFDVDVGVLEKRFKEAARKVHPDKFGQAEARARKAALSQTVKLNEAWRTLRDEERRATYLLGLAGLRVSEEGRRAGAGPNGETAPGAARAPSVQVPPALLMEVLELREALAEARARQDAAAVGKLAREVRERAERHRKALREALAIWQPRDGANESARAAVATLMALRYDGRFLDEVEAYETGSEGDAR
jgi:molecular chaperone HscB